MPAVMQNAAQLACKLYVICSNVLSCSFFLPSFFKIAFIFWRTDRKAAEKTRDSMHGDDPDVPVKTIKTYIVCIPSCLKEFLCLCFCIFLCV
jgi:hypothetical protein